MTDDARLLLPHLLGLEQLELIFDEASPQLETISSKEGMSRNNCYLHPELLKSDGRPYTMLYARMEL
jgi:hypothetical protein